MCWNKEVTGIFTAIQIATSVIMLLWRRNRRYKAYAFITFFFGLMEGSSVACKFLTITVKLLLVDLVCCRTIVQYETRSQVQLLEQGSHIGFVHAHYSSTSCHLCLFVCY